MTEESFNKENEIGYLYQNITCVGQDNFNLQIYKFSLMIYDGPKIWLNF